MTPAELLRQGLLRYPSKNPSSAFTSSLLALSQEHGVLAMLPPDLVPTEDWRRAHEQQSRTLLLRNMLFLDEYRNLNRALTQAGLPRFIPLKGLSLLNRFYQLNERSLTDLDVLFTSADQLDELPKILEKCGYMYQPETKWKMTEHKSVFIRKTPALDYTLEIHTRLFAKQTKDMSERLRLAETQLAAADEFLYLCYHWAYQHTCLKLFWLHDLYLFSRRYPQIWNSQLWEQAEQLHIGASLHAAAWALKSHYQQKIEIPAERRRPLLEQSLLWENLVHLHERRWAYLKLKHLLKDSWMDSLAYDARWLGAKLARRFSKSRINQDISR